jgi:hypothetical protein
MIAEEQEQRHLTLNDFCIIANHERGWKLLFYFYFAGPWVLTNTNHENEKIPSRSQASLRD